MPLHCVSNCSFKPRFKFSMARLRDYHGSLLWCFGCDFCASVVVVCNDPRQRHHDEISCKGCLLPSPRVQPKENNGRRMMLGRKVAQNVGRMTMVMLAQAVDITRHMQPQLRRTTIGSKSQGLMCCNGQSSNQAPTQRDTCQTTEDLVITQSCSPGAINRGYGSHVQHAPPDGLATALTRSSLSEPQPFCKCWRKCVSFFGLVVAS